MKGDNILLTVAVVAAIVSIVGAGLTYYSINSFKEDWITGFVVTDTATTNVTVSTNEAINFTTDNINFGAGYVSAGNDNATLDTGAGTVSGGTWTPVSSGFILENIGNVNVSLDIKTGSNAAGFIGGTAGGGPAYQYNLTALENGGCTNSSFDLKMWYDVNTTGDGTRVCDVMRYDDTYDRVRIDIKLVIPSDSKTGALGDTMTATATAV